MRTMTEALKGPIRRTGGWAGCLALAVAVVACDSSPADLNGNDDHADAGRVELHTRGAASALLAMWVDGEGWMDADGNAITELPNSVDVEGEGLLPLRARDRNASLTVKFFMPDGTEVEMATLSRDDDTRERQCTEFEARYWPVDQETEVISWPNMRHPDADNGAFQFARRGNGDLVGIFHCDHIHLYPDAEGTVDVEFLLWHIDHADDVTDPITVRVGEPVEVESFELQTRGMAQALLGVWNAWDGWRDADGNPIEVIEAPRDVEGEGLQPLVEGGSNASLTVRYFLHGGEQVNFQTVSRQEEDPRERVCSELSGRYWVEGDETDVIAWPPQAHPDGAYGDDQFAPRSDGTLVGIFHCDHIHIYPENAGEVGVRVRAWNGEEAVAESDPITFVVQEGE